MNTEVRERKELTKALEDHDAALGNFRSSVSVYERRAKALYAAGYRKPRTITTVEELDALPHRSVIFDGEGDLYQRNGDHWYAPEELDYYWTAWLTLPATVLHAPEAEK